MIAFIPVLIPLVPILLGAGLGASAVAAGSAACPGSGKRRQIAELKARIKALERRP